MHQKYRERNLSLTNVGFAKSMIPETTQRRDEMRLKSKSPCWTRLHTHASGAGGRGGGQGELRQCWGGQGCSGSPRKGGDSSPEGLEWAQEKQSHEPLPSSTWEAAVPHKCPGLRASHRAGPVGIGPAHSHGVCTWLNARLLLP